MSPSPLLALGAPPEVVAVIALMLGVFFVGASLREGLTRFAEARLPPPARVPWSLALGAALLSVGYIAFYLRGGPRIVDASTYFLQARALARGSFAFAVPEPSASFRGRFLLYDDHHLAGIFPPGYPLVLALGFVIGAPLLIGPLLAAALVIVTAELARELGADALTARFAALLSLACVTLRYHTADTMSHGAAALAMALAVLFALKKKPLRAGLALGWLLAIRAPSALPALITCAALCSSPRLIVGMIPGALLLLVAQKSATGSFFSFSQSAYYARSDGPPGCFRMGFGAGIGCVFEHGDVVAARLREGYGLVQALRTTGVRLAWHADDVLNGWPLALVMIAPMVGLLRADARARWLAIGVGLQALAYAPFYFDGCYPGGGGRHLADVLPLEHALVALALARSRQSRPELERRSLALLGAGAISFGLHGAYAHGALRDRDGGAPMFEPEQLARAGATEGIVFVETDHGFALGHDPGSKLVVARLRDDAHDRLLYERMSQPPTFRYRFGEERAVTAWIPPPITREWRFESESDWPPLSQAGGYAIPAWASTTCASNGRVLEVVPSPRALVTIALPVPKTGRWRVQPRFLRRKGDGVGALRIGALGEVTVPAFAGENPECFDAVALDLDLTEGELPIAIEARDGPLAVDRVSLSPSPLPVAP